MALNVGDTLPSGITLPDADGNPVSLDDFRGKPLVLYFYPKDDTPGCTAQACTFRDKYQDFQDAGATVVGVSHDSGPNHQAFAAKYDLPFPLLSDKGGKLRKQLGVPRNYLVVPGRVTYVMDAQGKVIHMFNNLMDAEGHVHQALEAIRS